MSGFKIKYTLSLYMRPQGWRCWNPPTKLVAGQEKSRYCTAHDLRFINAHVTTPMVSVSNPYVVMSALDLKYKWFTCKYLSIAIQGWLVFPRGLTSVVLEEAHHLKH